MQAGETALGRPAREPAREANEIDDRVIRAVGIPGFGLAIPQVAGLHAGLGPGEPRWWLGTALFVALAAAIWHGNRWLLFKQREHWTWFDAPVRKLMVLAAAIVFYTVPVTLGGLALWYALAGLPADAATMREVALINVICVVFVTHGYETVFLIKARESDLLRAERLERAAAQAELDALHAQIDPHFLFNSLNTLASLIDAGDPARARAFNERLARVYRYILAARQRRLVPLAEELAFVDDYLALLEIRFGAALRVSRRVDAGADPAELALPPIALQLLLENAVKHNRLDERAPLEVELRVDAAAATVSHPRRPRLDRRPSAGLGLGNLAERYRLVTGREIEVRAGEREFAVRLPLEPA